MCAVIASNLPQTELSTNDYRVVYAFFRQVGEIREFMPTIDDDGEPAIECEYLSAEDALKAVEMLDGKLLLGQPITVRRFADSYVLEPEPDLNQEKDSGTRRLFSAHVVSVLDSVRDLTPEELGMLTPLLRGSVRNLAAELATFTASTDYFM